MVMQYLLNTMNKTPLVSICCITFNHEKYLRDCIEGFLMQKTTFPVEILIFDDSSTDKSQEIIIEYASKNKNIITFLQSENQWQHKKYGLIDWLFPSASGKYIATCEGDDYWIDPYKLQKQVDFMESNENCNYLFTSCKIKLKDNYVIKQHNLEKLFDLHYLLKENIMPSTQTLMFRKSRYLKIKDKLNHKFFNGDWILLFIIANQGKIGYLKDVTAVYRANVGIVSKTSDIYKFLDGIRANEYLNLVTNYKYDYHIGNKMFHYKNITFCYLKEGKIFHGIYYFFKTIVHSFRRKKSVLYTKDGVIFIKHCVKLFLKKSF